MAAIVRATYLPDDGQEALALMEQKMADADEMQERLGVVLHDLRAKLNELNDEHGGDLRVTREDCKALRDCIDLALSVRLLTVDYR